MDSRDDDGDVDLEEIQQKKINPKRIKFDEEKKEEPQTTNKTSGKPHGEV